MKYKLAEDGYALPPCICHKCSPCPNVLKQRLVEAELKNQEKEAGLQCNIDGCKGNKWEIVGDRQAQRCGYCFRVLRILNLPETE